MTIDDVWKMVLVRGPSAVLVDRAGTTMPASEFLRTGQSWDMIYLRNDGWSLATTFYLAQYAEALHRADWIGYVRRGDKKPKPKSFVLDSPANV